MGAVIKFDWMMRDEVYANVAIDCDSQIVVCRELRKNVWEQFLGKKEHTLQNVYDMLESRCVERTRDDIGDFLRYYDLKKYNAYLLCRKTHGVSSQDFFWIRWYGENIRWDNIRIRG